ncbi:MAG: hypothetical protein XD95_0636 [Microgenomates bacterium 39_7]|nr:MAG: hypothetical protein XD95_0636 [Microgenomates bacterium 39_7]
MNESTYLETNQISNTKSVKWIMISAILITALIAGAAVYFWQSSIQSLAQQEIEEEKAELQSKLDRSLAINKMQESKLPSRDESNHDDNYSIDISLNDPCTVYDCLFYDERGGYYVGSAVITGYYVQKEKSAWGETVTCDCFTITEGSEKLIQSIIDRVNSGNALHSLNDLNQPVINIMFDSLSQFDREKLLNSSENNQLEISILIETPPHIGAPACFSNTNVLRIY